MYCAIKPITTVCSKRSGDGEAQLSAPWHGISLMTGGGRDKRVAGRADSGARARAAGRAARVADGCLACEEGGRAADGCSEREGGTGAAACGERL